MSKITETDRQEKNQTAGSRRERDHIFRKKRIPELLAPAGSIEAMHAALKAGADAVYIGGSRFGARAYADNPDDPTLLNAIDEVHVLGKRLYLTVNTLFKNREIERDLYNWLEPFYRQGLDGVIVQDPGVLYVLRHVFPGLELHASTQMAVTGPAGARLLKENGVCRVVPARELSLPEIRRIYEETHLDIECFVHGAMCYSYSGMCLMSSMIGGRSGNRGRCAGVCRLPFFPAETGSRDRQKENVYPLNMRDLCALELIPDLIDAGCCSFKIEGRMKRPEYTAGVTSVYREYIDRWKQDPSQYEVDPSDLQRLENLFNRDGLCRGYYKMHNGPEMIALQNRKQEKKAAKRHSAEAAEEYERIAEVLAKTPLKKECNAELILQMHHPAKLILRTEIAGTRGAANPMGDAGDPDWNRMPLVKADDPESKIILTVTVDGPEAEPAAKQPTSRERIEQQLRKTGDSSFEIGTLKIEMPEQAVFLPVSRLNALRREALTLLEEKLLQQYRRENQTHTWEKDTVSTYNFDTITQASAPADDLKKQEQITGDGRILWIQAELPETAERIVQITKEVFNTDLPEQTDHIGFDLPVEIFDPEKIQTYLKEDFQVRLSLPYIIRGNETDRLKKTIGQAASSGISGFLVRNLEGLGILKDLRMEQFAVLDAGLFTWNNRALMFYRNNGFFRNTVPLELNQKEIRHRDNTGAELILYGRAPMMISAQCVRKTLGRCFFPHRTWENEKQVDLLKTKTGIMTLTDRKHAVFPVVNYCNACYNVVYNSLPANLIGSRNACTEEAKIAAFRIDFTTESEAEIREVLQAARDWQLGGTLSFATTGGHYKRGVE